MVTLVKLLVAVIKMAIFFDKAAGNSVADRLLQIAEGFGIVIE